MLPVMINEVPVTCINKAAITYHVPVPIILSVIKKEGGHNGQAVKNKNGTYDFGVMQINSSWLTRIAIYHYTREDIQYDACKNVMVGTWILGRNIAAGKDLWRGVGNYHSHTPRFNHKYQIDIRASYDRMALLLNKGNAIF